MFGLHVSIGRQAAVIVTHLHGSGTPKVRIVAEAYVWLGKQVPVEAIWVTSPVPVADEDTEPEVILNEREKAGTTEAQALVRTEMWSGVLLAAMQTANGVVDAEAARNPVAGVGPSLPLFQTHANDWWTRHKSPQVGLVRLAAFYRPLLESIEKHTLSASAKQTAKWCLAFCEGIETGPAA